MRYALHVHADPQPRIAVEGLTFEVRSGTQEARRIVDRVSFEVAAGGVFTVLGPSGSGKSTLLRCLNRLIEPSAGRVLLDGRVAGELPVQELRRRVGMVFQTAALFDGTVLDNVLYGPRLRATAGGGARKGAKRAAEDAEAAHEQADGLLRRVGLPAAFRDKPVTELSGGEAQRVSLARALANAPEVLLLDEPTAALDPTASQVIEDLLVELAADSDLTFVFVTHNLAQARRIGDHGLLLVDGRVVDQGPLPAFLDEPAQDITRRFVEGRLQSGAAGALAGAAPPELLPPVKPSAPAPSTATPPPAAP
jgi:putative ABC transport system ATP-binding protein